MKVLVSLMVRSLGSIGREIAEMRLSGPRSGACLRSSVSVALAVAAALGLALDLPWWAGISAFVSSQVPLPASLNRGTLRIAGTVAGAVAAYGLMPFVIYDQVAFSLALMAFGALGVLGLVVSRRGYAWLFLGITANLVLLAAVADPPSGLRIAANRITEVAVGTAIAVAVALAIAPDVKAAPQAPAPGWSVVLSPQSPALSYALRAGFTVMLVPLVWNWLQLPGPAQMAITVVAVMAVPVVSGDPTQDRRQVIDRSLHRMLGCLLGGLAGLACLALSVTAFLPWLALLVAGVWIGAHVQASERGVGYAGTQGAVVFIVTLVQSAGPPTSLLPGIDRFVGIIGGLAMLMAVSALIWPDAQGSEKR